MEFESDKGDDESEFEKKEVNEDENDNDIRETDNDNEWSDIDWGELNNTEQQESDWKDIDWNADISSEQQESVWNEIDWKEPEQENPDDDKATERKEEQEGPDHNETEEESDQNELEGDVEKYDPYERGDNYEQEGYSGEFENEYAQTMSTILITENEMYAYLKQYIEAMLTKEKEQTIQGEQNEINNLQAEPSELEQFLEQEKERIQLEQQQAELDKTVDKEPESVSVEEDVEQEQEIEPQADTLEEIAPNNEKEVKHQVTTEEINTPELEHIKNEEKLENQEIEREELEASNIEKNLDADENTEQELKLTQEQNLNEIEIMTILQEEEEEEEISREIEEDEEIQQELDDILEQVREIEQGRLEQTDESKEDSKGEQEIEQQKEEEWLENLVHWVKEETVEKTHRQMKDEVIEIVENYTELDELTTKFQELFQKEQTEALSQAEKVELKTITKSLLKENPERVVVFTNLRAIKRHLSHQKLEKPQLNQLLNHFFTRFPPKKQLNRILKKAKIGVLKYSQEEIEIFKEKFRFSNEEIAFLIKKNVSIKSLSSRWAWTKENNQLIEDFFRELLIPKFKHIPSSQDLKTNGFSRLYKIISSLYPSYKEFVSKVIGKEYHSYYRKISYEKIEQIKQIVEPNVATFLEENKEKLPQSILKIIEEYQLGITYNTFKNHALEYLEDKFGIDRGKNLFFEMWGYTKISPLKITKIRDLVQKAIKEYETKGIHPPSLYSLSNSLKMSWKTFGKHVKSILKEKFQEDKAEILYRTFWEKPEINTLSKKQIKLICKLTNKELRIFQKTNKLYDPTQISELSSIENLKIKPDTFRKHAKKYLTSKFGHKDGLKIYDEMWPGSGQKVPRRIIQIIKEKVNAEIEKYFAFKGLNITPLSFLCSHPGIKISEATFNKYAKEYLHERFGVYGDILYSELWPSEILSLRTNSGRLFHSLISFILTSFFKSKSLNYFSEVQIYSGTKKVDGLILIEKNKIISELERILKPILKVESLSKYKAIIFDFTSAISNSNIIRKIKKYQSSEILFLIVGYRWYLNNWTKQLPDDKEILFPENIRVISLELFYRIFDFSEDLISKIKSYEDFVTRYDITNLKEAKLKEEIEILSNSSLKSYLKSKSLIKENINEFFSLGLREFPIKEFLTLLEINEIRNFKSQRIAIVDIETTSFIKNSALIVEIGIVELDINTGERKILFNAPIYENGIEKCNGMGAFNISNLDIIDVKKSNGLESYREVLQFIFDNYRITSYNTTFDLEILELRGFKIPKKMMDMMKFVRRLLPKGKYNFEFAYRYFYNLRENVTGKYLKNKNYEEQHRAIDDAIHEVELLFLLINKFKFPTSYQDEL